ncbi:hypothetical protein I3843_07G111400 [Carya illinoinensis]|uniref:Protein DEHYDRATION-INDUCED 19 homolog 4-like n=1 Tax=Carya illinoinensis TaxID=32201 RepID=A0A922ELD0_CARIL|nr:protein DEHYDRATION-INDUCED 19 homolog 4-like isoform X1 [Carya illinoinensis]XP_042986973.1 protein DEHYDRATION-INDUCED 19 homolog 4-like isoform X1 [Carya illinoinensis]KAG6704040.1 hypothetical protein I3842_07G116000 [Carya illinoinensis]KAG7970965.1 hypothetical protein I3843_07G111400 [Carya illinoinensis]KAG7970966.1 hypothetical protein I3843_07G111400 [Carya illinoinensis]
MEDDDWSFGFSTPSRAYRSTTDLCIDWEEVEADDDLKAEYPCPFCPEDFDLVGLCCHIDEEHPIEADYGVCPVCATKVGMNMVGHITTQHGNFFKNWHKLKLCKGESYSTFSSSRKEFQNGHFQSLLAGSSPAVSTSKMAPDSLLSFLYNGPAAVKSESVQPDSSTEVSMEDENPDESRLVRNFQVPLSDKEKEEKARRCEFVQGLFLSTIFDDSL